jgi:hypothetical protein
MCSDVAESKTQNLEMLLETLLKEAEGLNPSQPSVVSSKVRSHLTKNVHCNSAIGSKLKTHNMGASPTFSTLCLNTKLSNLNNEI